MSIMAAKLMVEVGANTSDAERGLADFSKKMEASAKKLAGIGTGLSLALTAPLVGIAKGALTMAGDYEQSMNMLQFSSQASMAEMGLLSDQALDLGAATVFSANEVAAAQLEMAKAGMDVTDVLGAMPGIVALAAAANMDLAESGGLVSNTLNMWGMEVTESTRVADMFAAVANATTADVDDFSMAIGQSGAVLAGFGVPLDDTLTMLGLLANRGLKGSDAGTSLKTMFMSLTSPTDKAAQLMNEFGISIYDANGVMLNTEQILAGLIDATGNLNDQQRNSLLKDLFGTDGLRAANILLDSGVQGLTDLNAEVNTLGAAAGMSDARMKGLNGGLEELSGSFESFLTKSALPFTNFLGDVARGAADALAQFGALPQPVINAAIAFGAVLAAAGPLMLVMAGVSAALAFLATPIGLIVAASAALAAAWAADMGGIQGATASAVSSIVSQMTTFKASALSFGAAVKAAFDKTAFPTLDELWQDFKAGDFDTLASKIRDTAFALMVNLDTELNITGKADQLKAQLLGVVNGLSTAVGNLDFSGVSANVNGLRDGVLAGLTTAINGVEWGSVGNVFAKLVGDLSEAISGLDLSGIDWGGVLKRILLAPLGLAVNGLMWVMGSENFAGLVTAVQGAIGSIPWGDIGAALAGLGTALRGQVAQIAGDMARDIGALLPTIKFDVNGMINSWTTAISGANWEGVGSGLVSGISTAITNLLALDVSGAEGIANGFANWVRTSLASIDWTTLDASLVGLANAVREAIYGIARGIGTEIAAVLNFGSIKIEQPQWLSDLLKWQPALPSWVTDLTTWDAALPDWVPTLIDWKALTPDWYQALLAWNPSTPSWVTDLVGWMPNTPDWVDSLLGWVPDMPGWVSSLLGFFGGGGVPGNAAGTSYWRGGPTWVGEEGPEIVDVPRGARIYNNSDSMAMAASGGGGAGGDIHIHFDNVTITNDMDLEVLANRLARKFQQRMR
ncbi:MAG: phage tail tape measure protein [Caldilineaceae bacterium]|nr:phage tail tape measure protein [Caldilineaceae bacterium]